MIPIQNGDMSAAISRVTSDDDTAEHEGPVWSGHVW